jgi:hypothetical protein
MAIASLSNLSLQTIANEFGGATPHSISEYYRNNGLIPTIRRNARRIPASSASISFSNFSDTAREYFFEESYRGGPGTITIGVRTGYFKTIFVCGVTDTLPLNTTVSDLPPPAVELPVPTITSPISSGFLALRTGPENPSTSTGADATVNGYSNITYDTTVSSITISLPAAVSNYLIITGYNTEPDYLSDLQFFTTLQYIAAFESSSDASNIILGPGGGVVDLPLTGPSGIGATSINVVLISAIGTNVASPIAGTNFNYGPTSRLLASFDSTNTGSGTTTYRIPGTTTQAAGILFRV